MAWIGEAGADRTRRTMCKAFQEACEAVNDLAALAVAAVCKP